MMDILIHNAFANNLKNVNAKLPVRSVIGIAGVSGSGKSTLVKDIISAYGAQNYALSLPMFERGFVANKEVLPVGSIENLPATLMIDVINSVNNPNSTLSTITGIHSSLRELYHKFGVYKCPVCHEEIENDIYTVLSQVPHTVFAEVKCDSRYNPMLFFGITAWQRLHMVCVLKSTTSFVSKRKARSVMLAHLFKVCAVALVLLDSIPK